MPAWPCWGECRGHLSTARSIADHSEVASAPAPASVEPSSLTHASSMGAHTCSQDLSVTQPYRGPSGVSLHEQPPASHIGKHTTGLARGQVVPTPVKASQRSMTGGSASEGPASPP